MALRLAMRTHRNEILILLICILAGSLLRFYTFDQKSLWIDEIHTLNDSKDGLRGQITFYKQNPTYLHPPLFFLLTHLFYPFAEPERDLRILPLTFGILCLPMIYLLARTFSREIAMACTLSLAFMAYHISLSQDGRPYPLVMFLGMAGLYFLRTYWKASDKKYLGLGVLSFVLSIYSSYSSILFVAFAQILWFYRTGEAEKKPGSVSLILLNGSILVLCAPWMLFLALNHTGQPLMDPAGSTDRLASPLSIGYGLLHDWAPDPVLMIASLVLLILFPLLAGNRKNAWVLLGSLVLPVLGLYFFCKFLNLTHFFSSRYFVGFLPLFLITLYLSLHEIAVRAPRFKGIRWPAILFLVLFIASNSVLLHSYYRAQKQDFRGLADYLKVHLREGDRIFDADMAYMPGILHYFGEYPQGRQYVISYKTISEKEVEFRKTFEYQHKQYTLYHSKRCCAQYIAGGNRLWIVSGKESARRFRENSAFVLKGVFDGSFLNFNRFPTDASLYLFLLQPAVTGRTGP